MEGEVGDDEWGLRTARDRCWWLIPRVSMVTGIDRKRDIRFLFPSLPARGRAWAGEGHLPTDNEGGQVADKMQCHEAVLLPTNHTHSGEDR